SAIDLYGDQANRTAARERLHRVAVEHANSHTLSAELRLIWARILVATAARERLHRVAVEQANSHTLSAELRLIWARILVATAASEESLRKVKAMLDGSESIPGIDVDTDLRWLILGQLSEEGQADVALIQATM